MVSQKLPFMNASLNDIYFKLLQHNQVDFFWKKHSKDNKKIKYSDDFKELIFSLLQFNPECRPSLAEIKNTKWYMNESIPTDEEILEEFKTRSGIVGNQNTEIEEDTDNYDPNDYHVHRSISCTSEDLKIDYEKIQVKAYTSGTKKFTEFFCKTLPKSLYAKLIKFANTHAKKAEFSNEEYTATLDVKDPEGVTIEVNILKVDDDDKYCVQVLKKGGDLFDFTKSFYLLKSHFINN